MKDIGKNRRRIWRETGVKDDGGRNIIEDMEYDIVEVFGKEVVVPSNTGTRVRRNDGATSTTEYVGIHILAQNDALLGTPTGGFWGGLRRIA